MQVEQPVVEPQLDAAVALEPVARLAILPEFYNSTFEGYATNYIHRNFWKVKYAAGEWDDAMSEAAVCFYECRRLYGAKVNSQAHFMALYKRMLSSWFTDWGWYDSNQRSFIAIPADGEEEETPIEPTCQPEGPLFALLSQASSELTQVLKLVLSAPTEVMEVLCGDSRTARKGVDNFFSKAVVMCDLPADCAPALEAELREILA